MGERQILHTIPNFYPYVTGPAKQTWEMARQLTPRGLTSTIVTTNEHAGEAPAYEQRAGVSIRRLPFSRLGVLAYRHVPDARRRLRDEPGELIHAHSYRNRLTTLAHHEARRRRVPYILQPHGQLLMYRQLVGKPGQLAYRAYDAATRKREVLDADAVIVATAQERDEAIAFGVPGERVHVVPVGVAPRENQPSVPGEHERLRVLFVGNISPGRNLQQLIRAVAQLPGGARAALEVRIVGPAMVRSRWHRGERYLEWLRAEARRLAVAERCRFLGPRHGEALEAQYADADVFVYPSRYENFGQTVLEAAAAGLPVLATATGVARDLVAEGETGHRLTLDDAEGLARHLTRLVEDREAVARMGRAMFERVQRHYRWQPIIEQYHALYAQLLQGS